MGVKWGGRAVLRAVKQTNELMQRYFIKTLFIFSVEFSNIPFFEILGVETEMGGDYRALHSR